MEMFLEALIKSGPIGVVLGIMIWDNIQMKKKLFEVIENNTKAQQKSSDAQFQANEVQKQTNKIIEKNTSTLIKQEQIQKAILDAGLAQK